MLCKKPLIIDVSYLSSYYEAELLKIAYKKDDEEYAVPTTETEWVDYANGETYPHSYSSCYYRSYWEDKEFYRKRIKLFKNKVFIIKKMYLGSPVRGWGILMDKEVFVKIYGT